ncbi:MAG TPA: hypothetical protein VJO35_15930 [Terriglobales bacterium]|nr:hypothetical protein [Terriglobales bacterium]
MHRAFAHLPVDARRVAHALILVVLGTGSWVLALPSVGKLWGRIFAFWGLQLKFRSEVILVPQGWGSHIHFALPCFGLAAGSASGTSWWATAVLTLVLFVGSFFLSKEALPWTYLVRSLCLLQATALVYFATASARFPHDLPGYTVSMLVFSCILIGLVPVLYALTFYLLDFGFLQKLFLTLVTMLHLLIFVPHQYLLHIYLLRHSILFMPVLYFMFGPFLDIIAFIGLYSWGMSWTRPTSGREDLLQER